MTTLLLLRSFWDSTALCPSPHSCGTTLLYDTHSCGTLLWDTLVKHSCAALLLKSPKVNRQCPVQDLLQKSHVKVSNTSISFETSSKSPAGSPIGAHAPKHHHNSQPHDSLRLPGKFHLHTSKLAQSTAPATKSDTIISS